MQATGRVSDRTGRKGFTYSLVNQASHRQIHIDTIWADTWTGAARQLACSAAAFVIGLNISTSSRRAPTWTPNEDSLRCYIDAKHQIGARHFDEAIARCRDGIGRSVKSAYARPSRGDTGADRTFLRAFDTYSDALNLIVYGGTGYSRWKTTSSGRVRAPKAKKWFVRIASDDATQLLWRYVTVLTFPERWVDRWASDLLRSSNPLRRAITGDEFVDKFPSPAREVLLRKRAEEQTSCDDTARRLRGFLHVRYETLLNTEFPLIEALLLNEDRDEPLGPAALTEDWRPVGRISAPAFSKTAINQKGHFDQACVRGLEQWIPWLLHTLEGDSAALAVARDHVNSWPRAQKQNGPDDPWRALQAALGKWLPGCMA